MHTHTPIHTLTYTHSHTHLVLEADRKHLNVREKHAALEADQAVAVGGRPFRTHKQRHTVLGALRKVRAQRVHNARGFRPVHADRTWGSWGGRRTWARIGETERERERGREGGREGAEIDRQTDKQRQPGVCVCVCECVCVCVSVSVSVSVSLPVPVSVCLSAQNGDAPMMRAMMP